MSPRISRLFVTKLWSVDGLSALLALCLAVALRLGPGQLSEYVSKFPIQFLTVPLVYAVVLNWFTAQTPVLRRDRALLVVTQVVANATAWMVSLALVYFQGLERVGRGVFILFGLIQLLLSCGWRMLADELATRLGRARRALLVGSSTSAQVIVSLLGGTPRTRIEPVGLLRISDEKEEAGVENLAVYTGSVILYEVATSLGADCVVFTPPYKVDDDLIIQSFRCRLSGLETIDAVDLYEGITGRVPLSELNDHWTLFMSLSRVGRVNQKVKRAVDVILSAGLLLITAPVMILVAVLIRLFMPGPVFYHQARLGEGGVPFTIIKFRTMVPNAEAGTGPVWAQEDDPRITRLGRVLRRWRLDELPQLLNVLRGDMSLVGPRPEREVFVADFLRKVPVVREGRRSTDPPGTVFVDGFREAINLYSTRCLMRPGLTGWAQVNQPYAASLGEAREKCEYDLYYVKHHSLLLDLSILLRTMAVVLGRSGR